MKVPKKILVATAVAGLAAGFSGGIQSTHAAQKGYCWGVVGAEEGQCGGKSYDGSEGWSCAGQNKKAEWGWKKTTKEKCESMELHKEAAKAFKAAGLNSPVFTKPKARNPLFDAMDKMKKKSKS